MRVFGIHDCKANGCYEIFLNVIFLSFDAFFFLLITCRCELL